MSKKPGRDIRLTDELERQLMQEAIEEQFRFKPLAALKNLAVRLAGLSGTGKSGAVRPAKSTG